MVTRKMSSIQLDNDVENKIKEVISTIRKSVQENPDVSMEISGYLPSKRGAKLDIHFLDTIDDSLTNEWMSFVQKQGGVGTVDVDLQNGVITLTLEYKKRFRVFQTLIVWLLLPLIYYYLTKINPERYLFR